MEFPIYTPWENLDAQTIQKVINSGINYRTYCDEKPWDVSFEIDFLPKEELIIAVLIDCIFGYGHGDALVVTRRRQAAQGQGRLDEFGIQDGKQCFHESLSLNFYMY